ncbi:unnamed protein product [Brassica rapa]|uniref:Uncharacterized protein n=1 Tax=Brassica campestris TaxID=3711 RepID=A0A8D9FY20_BRACM|nr:unnamed protein product [Brassica rapa]
MDVQASLFIKISKLHHFNPLMDTEQDHLTHARKTQSRAELSVVSDDLLQRERELHILPNEPEQHACKDRSDQRSSVLLQQQPRSPKSEIIDVWGININYYIYM